MHVSSVPARTLRHGCSGAVGRRDSPRAPQTDLRIAKMSQKRRVRTPLSDIAGTFEQVSSFPLPKLVHIRRRQVRKSSHDALPCHAEPREQSRNVAFLGSAARDKLKQEELPFPGVFIRSHTMTQRNMQSSAKFRHVEDEPCSNGLGRVEETFIVLPPNCRKHSVDLLDHFPDLPLVDMINVGHLALVNHRRRLTHVRDEATERFPR